MNIAYHFTGATLRDGTPLPAIGVKLVFHGKPIMCEQGFHFSLDPFDALEYAPGALLHKVRYGGIVELGENKGVCTERTRIACIDATNMLRKFACNEALRVLPDGAPDIVRRYLTTCDEALRNAAREATWNVAWNAVWYAAWNAAWYAAREAAWNAARDAVWYAAWYAAREAAWGVARDAVWYAARGIQPGIARDRARVVAWDKARLAQRARFNMLVKQAFEGK